MAVAIQQLRLQKDYEDIAGDLDALWEHSVRVASYAYALARSQKGINADTALLAGMMHGIGKIYVWSRASKNPELFSDKEAIEELTASWHTSVGKSILESWGLPDEVAAAAENYLDFEEAATSEHARMVAIIAVANRLALNEGEEALIEEIGTTPEYRRLQMEEVNPVEFVAANEEHIEEMRGALSA
jgi:putative nucleotidyltransferase with HDIG domain